MHWIKKKKKKADADMPNMRNINPIIRLTNNLSAIINPFQAGVNYLLIFAPRGRALFTVTG